MAREIMKTHDIAFANEPITIAAKAIFFGCRDVGFAPYGEYWRQMHKICVLEFLSVKRVQSLKYVREEEVAVMIEKISRSCSSGATIKLSEILISIINNIVSRSVLGRNRPWRLNLPPSPPKFPIIGNLHQLGKLPHRSLFALSKKYGPLMLLHLGHAPTLVVSSAEMATEIMKTNDIVFANRPMITAAKVFLYGGIDVGFSPYGEYWRQVRRICVLDLLSVKKVQSLKYVREEEVAVMIENISRSCASGATINLSEILLAISNNIVCRSVLGRKYEEKEGKSKFGELSREVMVLFGAFSFGDYFPSFGWMDVLTGFASKLNKTFRALDAFFDQVIEEHLNSKRDNDDDDKNDFVDLLLNVQKSSMLDIKLTRDNIKAIILVSLSLSIYIYVCVCVWILLYIS
ncbi:hypothetical protein HHK36_029544 [Tetracentron sinense]|uniref:Cytochrome P450 n=1 Tax=Tetracentron sinense TaxID=13715 RepID=A0A835D1V7_TETSI|nr:hypothetical protein HHK36_029544 [Tetracentron sinense]